IVAVPIVLLLVGGTLFWSAGRWTWARGWWLLAVFLVCTVVAMVYLWRVNPEIYVARRGIGRGTKAWDLAIAPLMLLLILATLAVAGLDDGRFRWLPMPDWVVWLGYLLLVAGLWVTSWAQAVNPYFEPTVRIQTDRGHRVVDTGPYAVIRHPGYAG